MSDESSEEEVEEKVENVQKLSVPPTPSKSRISIKTELDPEWEDQDGGKENWAPEVAEGTTATVEISISCRDLDDRDLLSKSDPVCVVFRKPPGGRNWIDFMRTEIIQNDLNPDFAAKVMIDYYFDRAQQLRFQVYDMDSPNNKVSSLTNETSLGFVDVLLSQIVQAGSAGLTLELSGRVSKVDNNDKPQSTIILIAEEMASEKGKVILKLCGQSIGTYSFGCIPPKSIFVLSKMMYSDEKFLIVHRSTKSRGNNPTWPMLEVSTRSLCNGNYDRILKLEIYQKQMSTGNLVHCGQMLTSLNKLLEQNSKEKLPLETNLGQSTKSTIRVLACSVVPMYTFIDYIRSAMQIHVCFSIDFTCSNGNPEDATSLHYLSTKPNSPNMYEQAILAVGNIMQDYNTSTVFPVFGFGARLPPYGDLSYDFNVNLTDSPNCSTIRGVLEAYRECLGKIQLYAPTYFAPVIKKLVEMARKSRYGDNYYILIILTDGVITDFDLTKKTIVEASSLPLSIVIIGIGEMDFNSMEELDGDSVGLSYKGKRAERDIVQFVAYRSARAWQNNTGENTMGANENKLQNRVQSTEDIESQKDRSMDVFMVQTEDKRERAQRLLTQSQLAQEILAEFPTQVVSYMTSKHISPDMIKSSSKIGAIANAAVIFKRKATKL